jgi:ABC-type ATPase involved in cell division
MLKHCLTMNQVMLPGPSGMWPAPLHLTLELQEVLLIEQVSPEESRPFLDVAATLRPPLAGQVRHWGKDTFRLPREERYHLRRRIACIAPGQVLLSRLTLGENIALGPCYYEGVTSRSVLLKHAGLLEQLALPPHLHRLPHQVEKEVYLRALWARELVKQPQIILAAVDPTLRLLSGPSQGTAFLQDYLAGRGAATLLLGQSLQPFHSLANRLLRREAGQLTGYALLEHPGRPLTDFLSLVVEEK